MSINEFQILIQRHKQIEEYINRLNIWNVLILKYKSSKISISNDISCSLNLSNRILSIQQKVNMDIYLNILKD